MTLLYSGIFIVLAILGLVYIPIQIKYWKDKHKPLGDLIEKYRSEYKIDVTKPPIFPPCHIRIDHIFCDYEIAESRAKTIAWGDYIKAYGQQLGMGGNVIH